MSETGEPPKKKRRSKWGIKPEDVGATSSPPAAINQSPIPQGPKAAEAAAAKINAMLAAQGKLAKSEPPPFKPPATPLFPASSAGLLSTPPTPLANTGQGSSSHTGSYYVQDKVYVGLGNAPSTFNVKEKLEGPSGSFLSHIASQTGAKVFLRGQGSGYIEPTSKKESFEALHIYISHSTKKGLESARTLCESLIETVKKECDSFMSAQQGPPPLGFGGVPGYNVPPSQSPYANPYQYSVPPGVPPPGIPGYGPPPPPPGFYHGMPHHPGPDPQYGYYPPPPQQHLHLPPPPPPPHHHHHQSAGIPPLMPPNSGPPALQPPGPPSGPMYGALPPPLLLQPSTQDPPPSEPAKGDAFFNFIRHEKEAEPRKFKEIDVVRKIPTSSNTGNTGSTNGSHLSMNNAGKNDSEQESLHHNEGSENNKDIQEEPQTEAPPPLDSDGFKIPSFPPPRFLGEAKDVESIKKPQSNGEIDKTSGKWQSLSTSSVLENKQVVSTKEDSSSRVGDGQEAAASSNLPISELNAKLMPPPANPDSSMKEQSDLSNLNVVQPEVVKKPFQLVSYGEDDSDSDTTDI